MNTADIPSQTLHEVNQAIAERRGVSSAALDRQSVNEPEFMAALAYVLGIPLVEAEDLTDALLSDCRALTAELETAALIEYKFVPMARRGETLIVISSSPWDPITAEVLLGYFQQCPHVKFALASPQCLQELLNQLKLSEAKHPLAAGYVPKPLPAKTAIPQPPPSIAPPSGHVNISAPALTPVAMPPGARTPTAVKSAIGPPAASAISGSSVPTQAIAMLTQEDIAHLLNVLAAEIQRLVQQKSRQSL